MRESGTRRARKLEATVLFGATPEGCKTLDEPTKFAMSVNSDSVFGSGLTSSNINGKFSALALN